MPFPRKSGTTYIFYSCGEFEAFRLELTTTIKTQAARLRAAHRMRSILSSYKPPKLDLPSSYTIWQENKKGAGKRSALAEKALTRQRRLSRLNSPACQELSLTRLNRVL